MNVTIGLVSDMSESLAKLEADMKEHVVRSAAHAGALLFYDEARRRAPVYGGAPRKGIKPGQLRDAIYRAFAEKKSSDVVKMYEVSWNTRKAPHGHLIEYGHWIVQKVNGIPQRTGRVPAIPFIRGSFDRAQDAIRAMRERAVERTAEVLSGTVRAK